MFIYFRDFSHYVMKQEITKLPEMRLTTTQKKVLLGVNAYPHYNDRQLADALEMKRSTVTIARHFLQKQGMYQVSLFPNFSWLDLLYVGMKYGNYGRTKPIDYSRRMQMMTPDMKIDEAVWSLSSQFYGFSLFYVKDFHPIREQSDAWNAFFKSQDPSTIIHDRIFPPQMIRTYKFLDTHACLAQTLGLSPLPIKRSTATPRQLRKKEQHVLLEWAKRPQASNAFISEKVGVSRSVVGAMKKRLLLTDVVHLIQLPAFHHLGINLGVFLHLAIYPEQKNFLKALEQCSEVVFLLGAPYDLLLFALFQDYDSYQRSALSSLVKSEQHFIREPDEILFSLPETKFRLDAAPFLAKVFKAND